MFDIFNIFIQNIIHLVVNYILMLLILFDFIYNQRFSHKQN